MRSLSLLFAALAFLALCLGGAHPGGSVLGQSGRRERPKLKDFGDSLERLKWDEQKRASVETKGRMKKEERGEEEEEVVRVETSLVVCDVLVLDPQGRAVPGLGREDFVVSEDG